jgi:energy-coupling factor transport system ATP-binding protein
VIADGKLIADSDPATILSNTSIVEAAHLKRTSLSELAIRAHIAEPETFIRKFIVYEQEIL